MQELLGKTMRSFSEGSIVKGRVLQKRTNEVLIDIGYKSEGVISLSEFEDDARTRSRQRGRSAARTP